MAVNALAQLLQLGADAHSIVQYISFPDFPSRFADEAISLHSMIGGECRAFIFRVCYSGLSKIDVESALRILEVCCAEGQVDSDSSESLVKLADKILNGIANNQVDIQRAIRAAHIAIRCAGYDRVLTPVHYRLLEAAALSGLPVSVDIAKTVVVDIMPKSQGSISPSLGAQDVGSYLRLCGSILASHRLWEDAISAYKAAYLLLGSAGGGGQGEKGSQEQAGAGDDPRALGRVGPIPIQATMLRSLCLRLWLLCCLIQYGKLSKAKKWATSGMPVQALQAAAKGSSASGGGNADDQGQLGLHKAYSLLLRAADSENASEMHAVLAQHEAVFVGDGQTASDAHLRTQQQQPAFCTAVLLPHLITQLIRCTMTRHVSALGSRYSRVDLQQAADALRAANTNAHALTHQQVIELLQTEIAEGRLKATLDLQEGSLSFLHAQGAGASSVAVTDEDVQALQRDISDTQELLTSIEKSDQILTVQADVLKRYVAGRRGGGAGGGAGGRFAMARGGSGGSAGGAGGGGLAFEEAAWGMDRRRGGGAAYGGMAAGPTEEQQLAWALQASVGQR